jgi:hypothetical protein
MTREEAYKFLEEESSNTQSGSYVHFTTVEKTIKAVSDDEELIEKALDSIYECEGNSADWMQLDDAKCIIDIALGIKDEISYF